MWIKQIFSLIKTKVLEDQIKKGVLSDKDKALLGISSRISSRKRVQSS